MESNEQLFACTFSVQYTNQRIDITSLIDAENTSVFVLQKREAPYGRDQSPRMPLWSPGGDLVCRKCGSPRNTSTCNSDKQSD
jgi:hypothetical protein